MKNTKSIKAAIVTIGIGFTFLTTSAQPAGELAPAGGVITVTENNGSLTQEEIDALVAEIRANPDQLDSLVAAAVNRDPDSAPLIVEALIVAFPARIQAVAVATFQAVQNSPASATDKTTIISSAALSAAEAARDTETAFAEQQIAVAAVSAAVQQVIPTAQQGDLVTTVQSVLIPPAADDNVQVNDVTNTNNDDDEVIPGNEQSPDQTTPTTL